MIAHYRHWERHSRFGLAGAALGAAIALPTTALVSFIGDADETLARNYVVLFLILAASVYGNARLGWSHPLEKYAYGNWLNTTPWAAGDRLPFGSPYLNRNDIAFVLAIWGGSPSPTSATLIVLGLAFIGGYVLRALGTAQRYDDPVLPLGMFIAGGVAVAFSFGPQGPTIVPFLAAVVMVLALSQLSIRRLLGRFNELVLLPSWIKIPRGKRRAAVAKDRYGSPWAQLLDDLDGEEKPSGWRACAIGVLFLTACCEVLRMRAVAWADTLNNETVLELSKDAYGRIGELTYFLIKISHAENNSGLWSVVALTPAWMVLMLSVPLSIAVLLGSNGAPISLLGRIATGRLYLPKYDIVWLAPVTACFVYTLGMLLGYAAGASIVVAMGLSIAAAIACYEWLSPSRLEWRLTGHHRIICRPPLARKK